MSFASASFLLGIYVGFGLGVSLMVYLGFRRDRRK